MSKCQWNIWETSHFGSRTVLLVVGVIQLIIGMNASHSVSDQMSQTFTGRFTQATTWYIVGGIASALLDVLLMSFGTRGSRA